ncbi:KH domain-containing protein [Candidatus Dependentiae bacterium]|nr:MAG: KH domain-containing protein [Candidatus Dependentiae bacterium]
MIKDMVEYLIKEIVEKPESVLIQERQQGDVDIFEITVDPNDRGKVIGREGQTIKALRVLISTVVTSNKKFLIDLVQL